MNYYLFGGADSTPVASAFAPEGTRLAHELISEIDGVSEMPFEFSLVKLTKEGDGLIRSSDLSEIKELWIDYLPNSLAWPLFSERLKVVIEENLSGNEGINWIRAKINGGGEQRIYFILRFSKMLDVIDVQKTMYVRGTDRIMKPCFSIDKVEKFSVFHKPAHHSLWKITSGLYVSEKLKKAIQKKKITGVNFEKTLTG